MKGTDGTVDNRTKELWSSVSGLTMHVTDREQNGAESMQEVLPSVARGAPRDLKQTAGAYSQVGSPSQGQGHG